MLDVKFIRENTEKCKTRLAMRGKSYDEEIDTALALDQKRRDIIGKVEAMKAEQNKVSKSIPQLKKAGEDVSAVLAQMKELSQEVKALDAEQAEVEQQLHDTLLTIPNVPADKVPEGADDTCNPELRRILIFRKNLKDDPFVAVVEGIDHSCGNKLENDGISCLAPPGDGSEYCQLQAVEEENLRPDFVSGLA